MATKVGTPGNDSIPGTGGDDTLHGLDGSDTLLGFGGRDLLFGDNGNDTLSGGSGDDLLAGDAGNDRMTGGSGADRFDYNFENDSGVGVGNRDIITDFQRGIDKIDLTGIDANKNQTGPQAFKFVGTAAPGAGEVGFFVSNVTGNAVIRLDVNGGADEMQIELQGVTSVSAADFFL